MLHPSATAATFDSELGDGRCLAVESDRGGAVVVLFGIDSNSVPASSSATLDAMAPFCTGLVLSGSRLSSTTTSSMVIDTLPFESGVFFLAVDRYLPDGVL